ncbi:MAG TPA: FliM/FliN family flagellar motor switch protein [Bryobacteraceae bacterium]|jgi:flagellar motor switch protein FliN/FliY|nr:FliM/FliN family flagellar motor switch protein [Bryobacteraceae bacterium]
MSQAIQTFLATWIDEFSRAVEMFSGALPALSSASVSALPEAGEMLWYHQQFSSNKGAFTTWIGAPSETWKDFGSADPDNPQSIYLEIVNQAQTGAATVASRAVENPITANPGEVASLPDFNPGSFSLFSLEIDNGRLPGLLIAIENSAPAILQDAEEAETPSPGTSSLLQVPEPLLDLELPVAISLGHAELPIKAVLNMKPGTPIELSTENGEDLELLVHGTVIARGEITMVKGNYALKINQIVGAEDRLSLLKR